MVTAIEPRPYHHGNLRTALIEAGLELTREGGPAALGLRDVTRRVGVSPNAAYRHFADRQALLAAVADRIQLDMATHMSDLAPDLANEPGPAARARQRLRAVGLGYIDFALAEPGWFAVAFDDITPSDLDAASMGMAAPLAALVNALDDLVATGALPASRRPGAEWPCWSTVHGFALLALRGPLRAQPPAAVRRAARRTVDTIICGLHRPA